MGALTAMRRALQAAVVALALASALGCARAPEIVLARPATLHAATDGGATPMFTIAPSGARTLAWVSAPGGGSDGRLYTSTDGAPASELRDPLGGIEPHGEAPPKIGFAPDGALYALYAVARLEAGRRFPFTTLRLARSPDGGRTWDMPHTVMGDATPGSRNFHALHVAADGSLYVAWLEARDGGRAATYLTRSTDGGITWRPTVRVAEGESCPCCRTAIATAPDGTLFLSWRTVLAGNVRDIVVASSADLGVTWGPAVRVHADDFVFDGCPHAGPSLQVDAAGRLHVAWWTGREGRAGVYYARSDDGGRTFGPPVALGVAPFARPAHAQVALQGDGSVVVAWDDARTSPPRVLLRRSRDGGATFGPAVIASDTTAAATFPVLALHGDSITVAWAQQSRAALEHAEHTRPDMKDPTAVMPLPAVGAQVVVVRQGFLPP